MSADPSLCSLEVILKDASDPSKPIEVARKELPYSFDVKSSKPRIKGPTSDQTQRANTGTSSSSIRRGARRPGPAATPSLPASFQLAMEPERQEMTGEIPDHAHAGQRMSGLVSSIGESENHNPSDVQCLPSAIPVVLPSGLPKPALLVQDLQPQHGSSGSGDRDIPEGGQCAVTTESSSLCSNAPRTPSASDAVVQRISDKGREQPYYTSSIQPPLFAHVPLPVFSTEDLIRVQVAEREVQINALETTMKSVKATLEADGREKDAALQPLIEYLYNQILAIQKEIADRLNAFSAERQRAEAAVSAQVADLEAQIHILREENSRDASALTTMADTTTSHRSYMG
jgi:hypothetical protein